MKKLLATAFALVTLTGCANTVELGFATEPSYRMYNTDAGKIKVMAKDPFTLEMAAFMDDRTPDQFAKLVQDGVIYEYNADKLLHNLNTYVPAKLARNLAFGEEKDRLFMVDFSLTKFRPWIETGSVFRGGFGGYVVDLAGSVRIRNEFSRVIMEHPIEIRSTKYRRAIDGYHPSSAQDRQAIRALIAESMNELAVRIGWLAHQGFVFDVESGNASADEIESEEEMMGSVMTEDEFMNLESSSADALRAEEMADSGVVETQEVVSELPVSEKMDEIEVVDPEVDGEAEFKIFNSEPKGEKIFYFGSDAK